MIYDQPVGKNDGSIDGQRYFTCEPNHGAFVNPKCVQPLHSDDSNGQESQQVSESVNTAPLREEI